MMATAMGRPKAKATAIVDVNAESKFLFGCTLSNSDMASLHGLEGKKPSPGQSGDGASLAHTVQKERENAAPTWLTEY